MVIDFSKNSLRDRPVLVLKNINGVEIQTLGYAFDIQVEIHFNEVSKLTFNVPKSTIEGEKVLKTPHYEDILGLRLVELVGYGQFVLVDPQISNDGVKEIKSCTAYSLEYELTYKQITLEESTYNFYDPFDSTETIMGIINEYCPSWTVGTVSTNLLNKYRTFEISGDNIYNFIKGTLQEKYRCIFDFDTYNRKINVISVDDIIGTQPVFLSLQNLLKDVDINEDSENVFTCLDVYGAEDVDIRSVNPMGTNKIYNLDYLINSGHVSDAFAEKWRAWEQHFEDSQEPFYQLVVEQSLLTSSLLVQSAAIAKKDGELTGLEAVQSTYVSALAQGKQVDPSGRYFEDLLHEVNEQIEDKQAEISEDKSKMADTQSRIDELAEELLEIKESCAFDNFFGGYVCPYCGNTAIESDDGYVCQVCGAVSEDTESELLVLDRCFKESSIEDSSFVANTINSYHALSSTGTLNLLPITIQDATITASRKWIEDHWTMYYTVAGGRILIGGSIPVAAKIISAAMVQKDDDSFVMSGYLSTGLIGDDAYGSGNISFSGTISSVTGDLEEDPDVGSEDYLVGTTIVVTPLSADMYFTTDTSEYAVTSVSWELYQYAKESIKKLSTPAYTFSVNSGNFMADDDFESFRKQIKLGKKIYLDLDNGQILEPICTGVTFNFDDLATLQLEFSDTYSSLDYALSLVDLLEESVSMGKTVSKKSSGWNAYVDSGAPSAVKEFIDGALDVTKNKLLSTSDQAISMDETGLRIRKWADKEHTVYEPEQLWVTDRSIVFTDDSWDSAKMAIGNVVLPDGSIDYGIVANYIVGTMIAGENLVISNNRGTFRIDESGIKVNGLNLVISSKKDDGTQFEKPLDDYLKEIDVGGGIKDYLITVGENKYLDASKVAGVMDNVLTSMSACEDNMVYNEHGLMLMNSVSPAYASKIVWMNNEGILLGSDRGAMDENDPSFNPDTGKSMSWKTAITADGIQAEYLVGNHLHASFDISAGTATGSGYDTCPFYVSEAGKLKATDANVQGTIDASRILLGGKDITAMFRTNDDATELDLGSIGIEDGAVVFYNNNLHSNALGVITVTEASSAPYALEFSSGGAMRLQPAFGSLFLSGGGQNAWIELTDDGDIRLSSTSGHISLNGASLQTVAVFG